MELKLTTESGSVSKKTIELSDNMFSCGFNESLVHQIVTAYMAGGRLGTRAHKSRAETRGGGKKPWRQKGTGRARSGTIRSPIWKGGGKTFAAKPSDYSQKVNRKMYQGAMRSIVSELIRQDRVTVVDDLVMSSPKTKDLVEKLKKLNLVNVLIISESEDENLALSARNIPDVDVCHVRNIDPVSLLRYEKLLVTTQGIKVLGEMLQ